MVIKHLDSDKLAEINPIIMMWFAEGGRLYKSRTLFEKIDGCKRPTKIYMKKDTERLKTFPNLTNDDYKKIEELEKLSIIVSLDYTNGPKILNIKSINRSDNPVLDFQEFHRDFMLYQLVYKDNMPKV